MSRDWHLYLEDILTSCERIVRYSEGLNRDDFFADTRTVDAVIRNLEIIGEASKFLPERFRLLAADVDWRKIIGLRDILIHAYFGVSDDILWDVVSVKVPELRVSLLPLKGLGA